MRVQGWILIVLQTFMHKFCFCNLWCLCKLV